MKPRKKLQLAYFGTPQLSADLLEQLLTQGKDIVDVRLVVTQADQPIGRKQIITSSPVKQIANKYTLPLFDTTIKELEPQMLVDIDLALIYFYGQIIPQNLLILPRYGFWNIHFSLLPQLRGPIPAAFSLILGDSQTAVSLVHTDEKLDHGPLITQKLVVIEPHETRLELEQRLHNLLYPILEHEFTTIHALAKKLPQQDHVQATYTLFPHKDHGFIPLTVVKKALENEPLREDEIPSLVVDYMKRNHLELLNRRNSAQTLYDYFRGMSPSPGLWTTVTINGVEKRLKITDMSLVLHSIVYILQINRVQLEGKNQVDFATFNRDYQVF